jgi:DNA-binding response OmpR family regulator
MPLTILVAVAHRPELRDELAAQLTADGHHVHHSRHGHATALLSGRHIDVLILGALEHVAAAPALVRELRAGTLDPRAWPELPTITLAPLVGDSELDALRAYEAGSDHHLPAGVGYLHHRAVLEALARRARGATRRLHRAGPIEVDTVAREVRVAGTRVELSAMEFALLTALASEPRRVFTKDELLRDVWGLPCARQHQDGRLARLPATPQAFRAQRAGCRERLGRRLPLLRHRAAAPVTGRALGRRGRAGAPSALSEHYGESVPKLHRGPSAARIALQSRSWSQSNRSSTTGASSRWSPTAGR